MPTISCKAMTNSNNCKRENVLNLGSGNELRTSITALKSSLFRSTVQTSIKISLLVYGGDYKVAHMVTLNQAFLENPGFFLSFSSLILINIFALRACFYT